MSTFMRRAASLGARILGGSPSRFLALMLLATIGTLGVRLESSYNLVSVPNLHEIGLRISLSDL